jgi:hypothetical protein
MAAPSPAAERHADARRAVPKEEVLAIFATAPAVDVAELRTDLDQDVSQDLRDRYEGTGL